MAALAPPPMIPHPQWSTDPPTGPGPMMRLLTEVTTAVNSIPCESVEESPPEDPDQSYRMIEMQEYIERQCMKQRRDRVEREDLISAPSACTFEYAFLPSITGFPA